MHRDGSTRNPTRSLCDPYVFNTAVTRAKSLVVSVGNPFLLLKIEKRMVQLYGDEHNAHCWSSYFDLCLQNGTLEFGQNLTMDDHKKKEFLAKIEQSVQELNHRTNGKLELEKLEKEVERLQQELDVKDVEIASLNLQQQASPIGIQPVATTVGGMNSFTEHSFQPFPSPFLPPHLSQFTIGDPVPFQQHLPVYPESYHGQLHETVAVASPPGASLNLQQSYPSPAFKMPPVRPNPPHRVMEDKMDDLYVDPDQNERTHSIPAMDHSTYGTVLCTY